MNSLFDLNRRQRHHLSGQGMSEMGIAIGLIAVVAIVGLTMLGGSVQNGIGAHRASLQSEALAQLSAQNAAAEAANGQAGASSDQGAPSSAGVPPLSSTAGSSGLGLSLGNGQYVDLGNYPEDLSHAIETAGANGATNMLLGTLEDIIRQAVANQTITPEQANPLYALADQGHKIGDIEAQMEAAVSSGANLKSVEYLRTQIGFDWNTSKENPETTKMRTLLQSAQKNGSLTDPVLNQAVSVLTNQIANISYGAESALYQVGEEGGQPRSSFNAHVVDELNERDAVLGLNTQQSLLDLGASVVSHQNASDICQAGKAGDTCGHS